MSNWFANMVDSVGTALNLPEIGLSEVVSGGNKTSNTGRVPIADYAQYTKNGVKTSPTLYSSALAQVNSANNNRGGEPNGNTGGNTQIPQNGPGLQYSGDASGSGGGSSSGGIKVGDAATIGQYQNAISDLERSLGLLPGQLEAGLNQINDGYNKGVSRLNEQQSSALSKFATQRGDTRADFDGSLGDIDTQSRGNYQAMQSLLGRNGAGSSSAASVITPYAVATEASKSRGKVADTYGRNLRDLDVAEDATKLSYENNKKDLDDTKRTSEYGLRQGIESNKAKLYGSIGEAQGNLALAKGANWQAARDAMGGSINAKNNVESALSTLLNQYRNPYAVKDVAVKEAKLNNYAVDANGVKIDNPNGTGSDTDTAALTQAQLKAEEERKKNALLV